jgi:hypothetical protein
VGPRNRVPFECDRMGKGASHAISRREQTVERRAHHERAGNSTVGTLRFAHSTQRLTAARKASDPDLQSQHMRTHPRNASAPELVQQITTLIKTRVQGRPGADRARGPPAEKKQAAVTTGLAEHARPSPRDGVTIYTHSPRGPAVLPPSPASALRRKLDLSSGRPGPCDFTVASDRSSARAPPRCDPTRPPHPAPDVRDDREAPLV